jgi:aspartyl-tRNA(Asn)/glutamyl-tRNA(Gln) amidotransferase subunit A
VDTQALYYLSLREAADLVRERRVSPVELLSAVLVRTSALEPRIHAYITPTFDEAMAAARVAEREILAGQYRGPLHGIPVALKDNCWTQGVKTTAGAKLLADFVPTEDATVVAKLRAAGAVITGKLNMHELAMGGTTVNPHYGTTHNPWGLDRIPGGSSGGSAAAVAAGFCYAALGTDTAGSIRSPAALCGVAGLKATYGRASIYGVIPYAWSLDHVGPLTRTVADAALVLNAIAGYDPKDTNSANLPVPDFTAGLGAGVRGLRLGVVRSYFFSPLDPAVGATVDTAAAVLRDLGATVEDLDWPGVARAIPMYQVIRGPEAASYQEEFLRAHIEDYGADVRGTPQGGALFLATDYLRAQRLRTALSGELATLLERVDAVLTPTARAPAAAIGETITELAGQPATATLVGIGNTVPFNLTGAPALSVPCGFASNGLPIGIQIAGRNWDEATVLRIGAAYEQATPWHERHPSL